MIGLLFMKKFTIAIALPSACFANASGEDLESQNSCSRTML